MQPDDPAGLNLPGGAASSDHHRYDSDVLTSVLLVFVAAAGPWVVQLAPRRQRLLALVGFTGVLVLWLVFENWFGKWYFWLALAAGIVSVLLLSGGDGDSGHSQSPRDRRPRQSDMTEEF